MPRLFKTIIPRIRRSLRERGLITSLFRSFLLPGHLLMEYRMIRAQRKLNYQSEFDQVHSVETDGEFGGWTYLSDLDIESRNWAEGNNYLPIEPERFRQILGSLDIGFDAYTFIDFGSGKGRALLLASEYPFKRITGLEFAPELHRVAETNIHKYHSEHQKCRSIRSLNIDFVDFEIPREPLVLFFFDPCREAVMTRVVAGIIDVLRTHRHPLYVIYVVTRLEQGQVFSTTGFFKERFKSPNLNLLIYQRNM